MGTLLRGENQLLTFLPPEEPERSRAARALCEALAALVDQRRRKALLVARVDGEEAGRSPLGPFLAAAGFSPGSKGYLKRAPLPYEVRPAPRLRAPGSALRGPLGPDLPRELPAPDDEEA